MILQALYDYYQRKASDPESGIAPLGLEWKPIPFIIVIDWEGKFIRIEDQTVGVGKAAKVRSFLVSQTKGRSGSGSWQVAFDFWDHYGYVLAIPKATVIKKDDEKEKRKATDDASKQNKTFVDLVNKFCTDYPQNKEFKAVSLFYTIEENSEAMKTDSLYEQMTKKDGINVSFRVIGESKIVAEHSDLQSIKQDSTQSSTPQGVCLITGERAPIRAIHSGLSIPGGKAGAKIVGFQRNSGYDSYGKEQAFNAPISEDAESAYNTALKTLLEKDSANKYRLGDTQFLFWAQKSCVFESAFSAFFMSPPKDDPDRNVLAIQKLMESYRSGVLSEEEETPFFLLGLSPNAARISVRSWRCGTVKEFAGHIRQHFLDLEIVGKTSGGDKYFSLFNLLTQIVLENKLDNLPPNMVGDMTRAILDGTPYPTTLQLHCLNRIKADRRISYIRAAILKAYINRKERFTNNLNTPITMALDKTNNNQAYLCGRLFAVLEKIQESANSGLNSTIKDRYYASASATPIAVFSRLLSLKNHHTAKLNPGYAIVMEKLIQEIMGAIDPNGFPKHLNLDDQSRFAIGYYHQRQDFFTSKENKSEQ
ncbi:MAG: type I-C CRISPR-associated protein Cas8c/Csd1 [Phocaeicola sp.]